MGFDAAPLLQASIKAYWNNNPGEAVEISYFPETVRLMMRGMEYYDPHFGVAFHDGWNKDLDHDEALARIQCLILLLHANFEMFKNGMLNGAIDQDEADRIIALIPGAECMNIDSGHVIHSDQPEQYIQIVEAFLLGE